MEDTVARQSNQKVMRIQMNQSNQSPSRSQTNGARRSRRARSPSKSIVRSEIDWLTFSRYFVMDCYHQVSRHAWSRVTHAHWRFPTVLWKPLDPAGSLVSSRWMNHSSVIRSRLGDCPQQLLRWTSRRSLVWFIAIRLEGSRWWARRLPTRLLRGIQSCR